MVIEGKEGDEFENNCGYFREVYRDENFNIIYGKLKPLTKAHYHLEGKETYKIEKGRGVMRIKLLGKEKVKSYELEPGKIITLEENEIHQIRSTEEIYAEVTSCPAWKKENEIEVEGSLF